MNRVILQPAGGDEPKRHFHDTMKNPVSLDRIKTFVSKEEYETLRKIYPDGYAPTWGVVPGKKNVNANKWERIESGFIALFSGQNRIFASGIVTYKLRNKDLAAALWDYDEDGRTWEYLYFLDELKGQDIPYIDFNEVIGYEKQNVIRGFNVLNEAQSTKATEAFNLMSELRLPHISGQQFEKAVEDLEGKDSLEVQGTAQFRLEQGYLRSSLFGQHTVYNCGICNREYPISFLIAAHLKKRAVCNLEEKKDVKSIVMPMCTFGCDNLYEKGYIAVKDGKVVDLQKRPLTPTIKQYLSEIVGNECKYWNNDTAKYFKWHFEEHSKSVSL